MSDEKDIVLTVYGHGKAVDKFSINILAEAGNYCETINSLRLEGESWIVARVISLGSHYTLESLCPVKFDILLKLDDQAIQKIMREVDSQELAKALKGVDTEVQDKIFRNMSKRGAGMLKEDMAYMGTVRLKDVEEAQEKIIAIMHHLESTGEIVIASEGEIIP